MSEVFATWKDTLYTQILSVFWLGHEPVNSEAWQKAKMLCNQLELTGLVDIHGSGGEDILFQYHIFSLHG